MLQVFGDYCAHVFRQNGAQGVFRLWAITLFDLVQSLIEEHLQKETFMTKSKFICKQLIPRNIYLCCMDFFIWVQFDV